MPTSRSGNPAKKAASKAADFKKKSGGYIDLPSGATVKLRRVDLTTLIAEKLLGDQLAVLAQDAVNKGKGLKAEDQAKLMEDPQVLADMFATFDKVIIRCWAEPTVVSHVVDGVTIPDEDRDEEQVYTDEVELNDKVFTFNVVSGGSTDLERFRREFAESVEGLPAGQGVAVPAQ